MRRFLIAFAVVAFCSAPTWADSVVDVNAFATFTATQPCSSNCTETIGMSFEFIEPGLLHDIGAIVPGTMDVTSSGFLGSFSFKTLGLGSVISLNSLGDDIDLVIPGGGNEIQVGTNTVGFFLFACQSHACFNAFGQRWIADGPGTPTNFASIVGPVAVPDETSFLSLALTALGTVGLLWRWRGKEANGA